MLRNLKLDERVDCKVNLHEFKAIKYLILKPEDILLLVTYQIKASWCWFSFCIFQFPNHVLVPEDFEEEFEETLKEFNINWYTEKQIALLSSKRD